MVVMNLSLGLRGGQECVCGGGGGAKILLHAIRDHWIPHERIAIFLFILNLNH